MRDAKHISDTSRLPQRQPVTLHNFVEPSAQQIKRSLRQLGADRYDLWLPESHRLAQVIQPGEALLGVVYGRYTEKDPQGKSDVSRGALIATDRRVLLLNKKPLFERCDEVPYSMISGVTYSHVGPIGNVILHTRIGDVTVRTFNQRCAQSFVKAVEQSIYTAGSRRPASRSTTPNDM